MIHPSSLPRPISLFFCAVLAGTAIFSHCRASSIEYESPQSCLAQGQYFETSSLTCQSCGSHQVVGKDGLACVCAAGYRLFNTTMANDSQGTSIVCVACANGTVVSQDGYSCVTCDPGSIVVNGECVCAGGGGSPSSSTTYSEEHYDNGTILSTAQCVTCASGYAPSASGDACVACPAGEGGGAAGGCSCPSPSTKAAGDGMCVPSSYSIPASATTITYADISVSINSAWFNYALLSSYALCSVSSSSSPSSSSINSTSYVNRTACQVLANLCVLQMYQQSMFACSAYLQLVQQQTLNTNGWSAWPSNMPWLYYSLGVSALSATDIAMQVSLSTSSGLVTSLSIMLAGYDQYGRFVQWFTFAQQAQMCPNRIDITQDATTVGLSYSNNCVLNLTNSDFLTKYSRLLFFDPYLVDSNNILYPIPVLGDITFLLAEFFNRARRFSL